MLLTLHQLKSGDCVCPLGCYEYKLTLKETWDPEEPC